MGRSPSLKLVGDAHPTYRRDKLSAVQKFGAVHKRPEQIFKCFAAVSNLLDILHARREFAVAWLAGESFEIEVEAFGPPLRNRLVIDAEPAFVQNIVASL